jgi:hypothetical protein
MKINRVAYKEGYHWVLAENCVFTTNIFGYNCETDFVVLKEDGRIFLSKDYAIDGITGITGYPWEKLIARPWLRNNCWPHDALYQLIACGELPRKLKWLVDNNFRNGCIKDGAYKWQANLAFVLVDKYGKATKPDEDLHPVLYAP